MVDEHVEDHYRNVFDVLLVLMMMENSQEFAFEQVLMFVDVQKYIELV
jgi:hypothetical protein